MSTEGRSDLKVWAVVLVAAIVLVVVFAVFALPLLDDMVAALEPGVGMRTAALWSFGVTVVLFVLFALVAGDGIVGELPFMLGGFFAFFVIITLLIAWIF